MPGKSVWKPYLVSFGGFVNFNHEFRVTNCLRITNVSDDEIARSDMR